MEMEPARSTSSAARRLFAQKERVLGLWVERVRGEIPAASGEPPPILVDTIPAFISNLVEALSPEHPRSIASEGSTIPDEHGGERVRLTRFGLRDVIREYQLLRDVLLEVLNEDAALTDAEQRVITLSIDTAVCDASTAYVLVSEGLRERMMMTLAHDLRGPLSAAKAAAALILRQPSDPAVRRWAARVGDNIGRVDKMLRTLLDVSRAGSGARLNLQIAPCEIVAVVRGVVETLALTHGDRIKITAHDAIHGHWSAEALARAVENLLTNALKYGDPHGSVTISLRRTYDRALLHVHNDGSYIPPEERETIFEAFRRSHEAEGSEVAGWGLGLALARAVAEAHGGSISVDSLPGTGTTFVVDIPVDSRPFQDAPLSPGAARS